jgi:hypothetical protein
VKRNARAFHEFENGVKTMGKDPNKFDPDNPLDIFGEGWEAFNRHAIKPVVEKGQEIVEEKLEQFGEFFTEKWEWLTNFIDANPWMFMAGVAGAAVLAGATVNPLVGLAVALVGLALLPMGRNFLSGIFNQNAHDDKAAPKKDPTKVDLSTRDAIGTGDKHAPADLKQTPEPAPETPGNEALA